MQASSTDNPPLVLPLKPPAERKVPVRLVHTYPPERLLGVCMPVLQCKSSLATGYFPFMWCGALVHEGTLRFGSLCFSGCFGLMLQPCPWVTLWGGRARTPPPTLTLFKASSLGPCGTDASSSRPDKEGPSCGGQAFITPFFISFFFGSERCVCFTAPVSPPAFLFPPCFRL